MARRIVNAIRDSDCHMTGGRVWMWTSARRINTNVNMIASMCMGRLGRIVNDSDSLTNEPQMSMPTWFHTSRGWTELRGKGFRVSSIEWRLRTRVLRSARWRAHLWMQRWIQTRCEWKGLHRFVVLNTWLSNFFPSVSPIVIFPIMSCQMLQLLLLIYPRCVSIRSSRINMKRCPAWEIRALVIDCVWTTERINWVVIVTRDIHWKKTSHFIVRVL